MIHTATTTRTQERITGRSTAAANGKKIIMTELLNAPVKVWFHFFGFQKVGQSFLERCLGRGRHERAGDFSLVPGNVSDSETPKAKN
jgi:hypothetical protein